MAEKKEMARLVAVVTEQGDGHVETNIEVRGRRFGAAMGLAKLLYSVIEDSCVWITNDSFIDKKRYLPAVADETAGMLKLNHMGLR